jgi:beta-N-acetylhexosaminidase
LLEAKASQLAAGMDIKLLAAQVLLSAVEGRDTVPQRTRILLSEVPAGGVMLFAYNIGSDPEKSRAFIEELSACISVNAPPPFIASDQEGGSVQRFRGEAALPPPLSYWENFQQGQNRGAALLAVERDAAAAGQTLRRIGVNLNLAPLAEFLTGENSAFLKNRSYGPSPDFVREAAAAFVRGMGSAAVASTVKHFPGNSGADPHRNRAALSLSAAELDRLMDPFRYIIEKEEPAAVMVSHVIIPLWDTKPSSRSAAAVRRLREMGFRGIVVADDFSMAAAGAPPEICIVEALNAGVDMIMAWPADLRKLHQAVMEAARRGELREERLREAAGRILYQKLRYGLISYP